MSLKYSKRPDGAGGMLPLIDSFKPVMDVDGTFLFLEDSCPAVPTVILMICYKECSNIYCKSIHLQRMARYMSLPDSFQ